MLAFAVEGSLALLGQRAGILVILGSRQQSCIHQQLCRAPVQAGMGGTLQSPLACLHEVGDVLMWLVPVQVAGTAQPASSQATRRPSQLPTWLDGNISRCSTLGDKSSTAQVMSTDQH